MSVGDLHTKRTWAQIMDDLRIEFSRWGVLNVRYPILSRQPYGSKVAVEFVPPGAQAWQTVDCGRFPTPQANLLAIAQVIETVRKIDQRGMGAQLAQAAAHLLLPASTVQATRSPEQILGLAAGMTPKQQVDQARQKMLETHPDKVGGSAEAFREVRAAAEKLGLV